MTNQELLIALGLLLTTMLLVSAGPTKEQNGKESDEVEIPSDMDWRKLNSYLVSKTSNVDPVHNFKMALRKKDNFLFPDRESRKAINYLQTLTGRIGPEGAKRAGEETCSNAKQRTLGALLEITRFRKDGERGFVEGHRDLKRINSILHKLVPMTADECKDQLNTDVAAYRYQLEFNRKLSKLREFLSPELLKEIFRDDYKAFFLWDTKKHKDVVQLIGRRMAVFYKLGSGQPQINEEGKEIAQGLSEMEFTAKLNADFLAPCRMHIGVYGQILKAGLVTGALLGQSFYDSRTPEYIEEHFRWKICSSFLDYDEFTYNVPEHTWK